MNTWIETHIDYIDELGVFRTYIEKGVTTTHDDAPYLNEKILQIRKEYGVKYLYHNTFWKVPDTSDIKEICDKNAIPFHKIISVYRIINSDPI